MNLPILVCDSSNSINDLGDVQRVTSYIMPSIISYQINVNVVVYWFFSSIVYINYMLIAILNLNMQIQK